MNNLKLLQQVEGSANIPGRLADIEVNGSGYPTDDEDGDDVHGSGGYFELFLTTVRNPVRKALVQMQI